MANISLYICLFFLLIGPIICAKKDLQTFEVNLANRPPGESLTQFHNLNDSAYGIHITDINADVKFFIIQVHTFIESITISYKFPSEEHSYTTGTNVGLFWQNVGDVSAFFYLIRSQTVADDLRILLVVSTYSKDDPVPGGCNLSFETELAPYQKVNLSNEVITVTSQPPSLFGVFCHQGNITTEMYYLYLNEYDRSSEEYFLGIQKMASVDNITKFGTKVQSNLSGNKFKQMYNRYSGTGRIFAVVSTHEGRSSAYVPAASFGCNLNAWEEDCIGPYEAHWKLVTALLLFCGLFVCLAGHRYFRTGLFMIGYAVGVLIMMILVTVHQDFTIEGEAIYALLMGIFVAVAWVFIWWMFGIPVLSVQLAFLLAGFLIASIVFYSQLGNAYIFADELAFWASFGCILVMCQMPSICLRPLFYIISLSLIGSYAITVSLNYYTGGNLPYIVINTFRRMTMRDFGSVVIDPPFQLLDISQTILWILIFGIGIYVQYKHSLGKPPFPPHRRGLETRPVNETTPLLLPEEPPAYCP